MQHYTHGRARIITSLGIVDSGVTGDMCINSMPATDSLVIC